MTNTPISYTIHHDEQIIELDSPAVIGGSPPIVPTGSTLLQARVY